MAKATVSVSLPTRLLADLDDEVESGRFDDRSEAVQQAVRKMLNSDDGDDNGFN